MTSRAVAAERTREALLAAGLRIAGEHGLAAMSVNRVVGAAGVAKGTFYVHFPDRGAFLNALHERFHEEVAAAVGAAMAPLAPGRERLRGGMATYLDLCLRNNGVKAMLLEARSDPGVSDQVTARTSVFAVRAEADLRAMGWPDAASAARLVVAMSAELSVVETTRGAVDADGRATLWSFLDRLDLGVAAG
ncbi:TetR/AcrR family transcriptional regulator [Kitasatospora sp. NBC_01287]|uniref:TetR/AcrR family transcriptional regulator n=1 Tax=Kitasatospora sp. NBC_01287 TaxID=2903573 RepID=UPI0022596595|nr:TetR/AcrR family transcriptional regulator [Kitasatospora sp. NBC_01287]MCX4751098.1 TetR/AcrR family transcriptional regulator [Kitasatospora sp. NBC_01287]